MIDIHPTRLRAVDDLAAWLSTYVDRVFGVGGANIEDLFDALHTTPGITPVLANHENSAGSMAHAYALERGGLAVVITTSGAGALNVIPALGEAHASRRPILAIVGEPPQSLDGRSSLQDTSGRFRGRGEGQRNSGTSSPAPVRI